MEDRKDTHAGGCMCGAVRYQVSGKPIWVGHCHCRSCRRHSGAPVVTFAAFSASHVVFTKGQRRIYNSSPGVGRAFCGACGTPLTWEGLSKLPERGHVIEFHISTLDEPETFRPMNHVFYQEKLPWFDVADHLPRYVGLDFNSEICRYGPADGDLPNA